MAGGTPRCSLSLYPCFLKDLLRAPGGGLTLYPCFLNDFLRAYTHRIGSPCAGILQVN